MLSLARKMIISLTEQYCLIFDPLKTVSVPRKENFAVDVDGIINAVETHKPKIVFLTSPNNPDGR